MVTELIQNPVKSFNEEKNGYLLLSWENYFHEKVIYLTRLVDSLIGQLPSFEKEEFSFVLTQCEDFLNNPKKQLDQEKVFFQKMLLLLDSIKNHDTRANCAGEFFVKLHNVSVAYNPIKVNFDPKNVPFESFQKVFDGINNSKSKLKYLAYYVKLLKKFSYSPEHDKFINYFLSITKEMITPKNSSINELIKVLDINSFPIDIFLGLENSFNYTDKSLAQSLSSLENESNKSIEDRIDEFLNQFLIDPIYDENHSYVIKKIKSGEFGETSQIKLINILKKILDEKIDDPVFYEEVHDNKKYISLIFGGISTLKRYQKQIEKASLLELWEKLSKFINVSKISTEFADVQNLIPLIFKRQKKIIDEASKEELLGYLLDLRSNSKIITETSSVYARNQEQHQHTLSGSIDPFLIGYNAMLIMKISERLCII